jgi:hypothetical protein
LQLKDKSKKIERLKQEKADLEAKLQEKKANEDRWDQDKRELGISSIPVWVTGIR